MQAPNKELLRHASYPRDSSLVEGHPANAPVQRSLRAPKVPMKRHAVHVLGGLLVSHHLLRPPQDCQGKESHLVVSAGQRAQNQPMDGWLRPLKEERPHGFSSVSSTKAPRNGHREGHQSGHGEQDLRVASCDSLSERTRACKPMAATRAAGC